MNKLISFLIILALLTLHSCDLLNTNNDPTLPEITQEGKGTFGCMIDGKLFLPKGPDPTGGMRGNPHAKYTEASGTLRIAAQNTDTWLLSIRAAPVFTTGIFQLGKTSAIRELGLNQCRDFYADTLSSNITVTFIDKTEDIVSGTFSGNFINECDSTNIIHITEGRFDLIYTL